MAMIPDTTLVWLDEDPAVRECIVARLRALPIVQKHNPELKSYEHGSKDDYRTLPTFEQYMTLKADRKHPGYIPLCPSASDRFIEVNPELGALARTLSEEYGRQVVGFTPRARPAMGTAYLQLQINTETLQVVGVHVMSDSVPTTVSKVTFVRLEEVTASTTIFSANGYSEAATEAHAHLLSYPWLWRLLTSKQVESVKEAATGVYGEDHPLLHRFKSQDQTGWPAMMAY